MDIDSIVSLQRFEYPREKPHKPGLWKPLEYRVTRQGCHECISHRKGRGGYPQIMANGKQNPVHRFVFEDAYGPIPEGMMVLHSCDNRACMNQEHLFLGLAMDNSSDMVAKGRSPRVIGETNGQAKLTAEDVQFIRRNSDKYTQRALAARFKVAQARIWSVIHRRTWSHVV